MLAIPHPQGTPSPIADALWDLAPRFVITTNYDSLLEQSLARSTKSAANVLVPGRNTPPIITDFSGAIGKLHGDPSFPESIVLSRGDYFRAMMMMEGFSGIAGEFVRRPTFAIGYSLRDPDLQLLLYWAEARLHGFASPLFLVLPELADAEQRLLTLLPGVVLMEYPRALSHRQALLDLLARLKSERNADVKRTPSVLEVKGALLRHFNRQLSAFMHDVRGPLAAAVNCGKALELGVSPEHQAKTVAILGSSLQAVCAGLDAIHDIVRAGEGHMAPSSWSDAKRVLIEELGAAQYKPVVTEIDEIPEGEIPFGARLYSVLVRVLVDNALEACEAPHEKKVSLHVHLRNIHGHPRVRVEVRDCGVGISPQVEHTLFQPNASTKGPDRGLGLYLLRALVEEVGGRVEIFSSPGRGTTAAFWLPMKTYQTPAATAAATDPRAGLPDLSGTHVMIVEDDALAVAALTALLENVGSRVESYADGESAMSALSAATSCPDCIITDIVMPRTSGFDVIQAVRARWARVPIFVISAYNFVSSRSDSGAGLDHVTFFIKPVDASKLLNAISAACSQRRDSSA